MPYRLDGSILGLIWSKTLTKKTFFSLVNATTEPYIRTMKLIQSFLAATVTAGVLLVPVLVAAGERSVVVELFTSEGCSSCPPAHAVIGRIARNPKVLALSFHVDYWDYIGWKDSFAAPWATLRQKAYASHLSNGRMYTPQIVISGNIDVVGSRAPQVMRELERALAAAPSVPLLKIVENEIIAKDINTTAELYLVRFDPVQETRVLRGENAGRQLLTFNVVRTYRKLADWDGTARRIPLPSDLHDHPGEITAIIAQHRGQGPVVGAAVAD